MSQHTPGTTSVLPQRRSAAAARTPDDASTRGTLAALAAERSRLLRDDGERGSQTAEYAMVGGVGAAAAAALIFLITKGEVIEAIVTLVLKAIGRLIGSWF